MIDILSLLQLMAVILVCFAIVTGLLILLRYILVRKWLKYELEAEEAYKRFKNEMPDDCPLEDGK